MSLVYFPSCKFTAQYPEISKKVKSYLRDGHGAEIAACCRARLDKITGEDTIVYICNTCAAFSRESTPAAKVVSVWELLSDDAHFSYPSHGRRRLTLQDCWRVYDNAGQQEAVRQVLRNMDIDIVELDESRGNTRFCGCSLYKALPARYDVLAPKRLVEDAAGFFQPRSEAEQERLMKEHCDRMETPDAVCYCVACTNGVNLGGKNGMHLAELVFGA